MSFRQNRLQQLEKIRNPNCKACPLHKSTVTVCVMGRGNPCSSIMLVGEAPGEMEAETGKPFMGPAGQLLDRILDELQMTDRVYITNIAKCRPPENRRPSQGEANICTRLYLQQERQIVKPKITVLMGRTPIDRYLGKQFNRGQIVKRGQWLYIATWHPSYLLRGYNPDSYADFRQHLQKAISCVST